MSATADVLKRLDELGVGYTLDTHPAVYTIEEMDKLGLGSRGEILKNLFLRNAKGDVHYLVSMPGHKQVDLAVLARELGSSRLSFASPERLKKHLGLGLGSVTPLGVLSDSEGSVIVVLDSALAQQQLLGIHPNENTATVWLTYEGLLSVLGSCKNTVLTVAL